MLCGKLGWIPFLDLSNGVYAYAQVMCQRADAPLRHVSPGCDA